MNIEQLEHILEVSKTKSLAIASENLGITQSGISRSISNLENELDIQLFSRSKSGTLLTIEGEEIVKVAYEALAKIKLLKEKAQLHKTLNERLKIAASPSPLIKILDKTIPIFKKAFPAVQLEITEQPANEIIDNIRNEKVDVGITFINEEMTKEVDLKSAVLFHGRIHACVNKNSPLSVHQTIQPEQLLHEPLSLYNGVNVKRFIHQLFEMYGKADVMFTSNNMETIKKTVIGGLATAIVLDISLEDDISVKNGDLVLIPLTGTFKTNIPFGWIQSKNKVNRHVATEFVRFLELTTS
ncbi:LysR family transcriptional regulator [Gottfriedia sp. NPDC056225]|uniref:LysR family transcriptional regulator n=1 Tax=Gottfriedia sp. NPDC056225 TaxID=3345751 RepID=UPI0035DE5151